MGAEASKQKPCSLFLNDKQLVEVPNDIFNNENLCSLCLSNNYISDISDKFYLLDTLTELDLSKNKLIIFPNQLLMLNNLVTLDLSFNSIGFIPKEITCLTNLINFNICNNLLKSIPNEITIMKNLAFLNIACNYITANELSEEVISYIKKGEIICGYYDQFFPDEIEMNLYLGSKRCFDDAEHKNMLKLKNVKYILSLGKDQYVSEDKEFETFGYQIEDVASENILFNIDEMIEYIDNALDKGDGCLVHCTAGVSRSASVIIAYLMQRKRISYTEAFDFVQSKRPCINPNLGFQKQLIEYDNKLRNIITQESSQTKQEITIDMDDSSPSYTGSDQILVIDTKVR